MTTKIKKITKIEARKVLDVAVQRFIDWRKEPILAIGNNTSKEPERPNPLLDIEVSLRRCERVGVFSR